MYGSQEARWNRRTCKPFNNNMTWNLKQKEKVNKQAQVVQQKFQNRRKEAISQRV